MLNMLIAVFTLSLVLPMQSYSETNCDFNGVQSIQVPVYSGVANSPKFKYSFRVRQGDKDRPLILVLGGGPGQNPLAPGSAPLLGAFPEKYTLDYTDPRSIGCNNTYPFVEDSLSTLALADDVAAMIESLYKQKLLKQPYFIYGASFGTQHATVLTRRLQQLGLLLPKAVVLEGVSGHHFSGFNDYFKNFQSEWERIKQQDLKLEVRAFFEASLPTQTSSSGYSSNVWGQFLSSQIILGYIPQAGKKFQHLIDWYLTDPNGQAAAIPQLNNLVLGTNDGQNVPVDNLFKAIGCREIWGEFFAGRNIVDGRLVATSNNVCEGIQKDRPYDSKSWQIPVPIYYVQGKHDPTTTLEHAKYHFENQTSPRKMIVVERASHGPLSIALRPCANQIWDAMTSSPEKLEAVAQACGQALRTEIQFYSKE
ncbi:MAG: hypothetical protein AB7O96_17360 [Pseudobdellovibrionaceae bacterium]